MSSSIGVGMTKFEKPGARDWDYPDMGREAGEAALADAGIAYDRVEHAIASYIYGDSTCGQTALYELGLTGVPVLNVNNNCSSGSSALYTARKFIQGGLYDCVLALGFEKMERGSLKGHWSDRVAADEADGQGDVDQARAQRRADRPADVRQRRRASTWRPTASAARRSPRSA